MALLKKGIERIVSLIEYKPGWVFYVGGTDERPYLQIRFDAQDNDNPSITVQQHCRKWYLSPYMIRSEIVRAAWKAVLAAEEHEAAEKFTLMGVDIFNPHIDLFTLANAMKDGASVEVTGRPQQEKITR